MKKNTGNKKVMRVIACALATAVAVTSTPVATLADDNAEESAKRSEGSTIVVENLTLDFSSGNLNSESKNAVTETVNATNAAADAESAAAAATAAATQASTAKTAAETAAANAETVAAAAQTLANVVSGDNKTIDVDTLTNLSATTSGVGTANGLIDAAQTAEGSADSAVSTANGAIATYNAAVEAANGKIQAANDSKDTKDESGKSVSGTDLLIQAANTALTGKDGVEDKVKAAQDNYVSSQTIKEVKQAVSDAAEAYTDADKEARGKLDTINKNLTTALTGTDIVKDAKEAASGAETAKGEAETHDKSAQTALEKTESSYNEIVKLVNANSHDVSAANKFAQDATLAAQDARQAANNAEAAAKTAAAAEAIAKGKVDAASGAVKDAVEALKAAKSIYGSAYNEAKGKADTADERVEDLIGTNTKKGKIDIANEKIQAALDAIDSYNKNEVKNANDAIAQTNRLIQEALNAIAALDDSDMNAKKQTADGLITAAGTAGDAAVTAMGTAGSALANAKSALETALTTLGTAKDSYDAAVKDKKTAEQYAADAKTASDKADEQAGIANAQYLAAVDKDGVVKDYLAKATSDNGDSYEILKNKAANAKSEFDKASQAKDGADADVIKAQNNKISVDTEQDKKIGEYNTTITNNTNALGTATTGGLYKQQADLEKQIGTYSDTIKTYEGYINNNPDLIKQKEAEITEKNRIYNEAKQNTLEKQAKYDDLPEWRVVSRAAAWLELQDAIYEEGKLENQYNELVRQKKELNDNLETAKANIATVRQNKSNAETTKQQVNSDISTAEGNISQARKDIETAKSEKSKAQSKLEEAQRIQGLAADDLGKKTKALNTANENLKRVDDFVATEDNTLVINEEKAQMIQRIISQYGTDYTEFDPEDFSYIAMNADTDAYAIDMSGTAIGDGIGHVINFFGKIFTGHDVVDDKKNAREQAVEAKYGNTGNVLVYWDDTSRKLVDWTSVDEQNLENMKKVVSKECVIICTDVKRLSEIKASLAVIDALDAKKNAATAQGLANAALTKANAEKEKEKTALAAYNGAKTRLSNALNSFDTNNNLKLKSYAKKSYANAFTPVETVNSDSLVGKYTNTIPEADAKELKVPEKIADADRPTKTTRLEEINFDNLISLLESGAEGKAYDAFISDLKDLMKDETIAPMIENLISAHKQLEEAKKEYADAQADSKAANDFWEAAKKKADDAEDLAKKAVELAKNVQPARDDDDDDDGGSSSDGPATGGSDTYTLPSGITVIPLATAPSGVAGVRTGRRVASRAVSDNSGVLGVKAEETDDTKKNVVDEKKDDTNKDDIKKSEDGSNKLTKVADPATPLADSPFEEGANMNLLWLLAAAVAAGAGVYGYDRHRRRVAADDEARKYKK